MAPTVTHSEQRDDRCKCIFIWFLRTLKVIAILSLLLNIVAFCLVMKNAIEAHNLDNLDKAFVVLSQSGFSIFSIICIIAEFEPIWFIRFVYLLHYWAGRGGCLIWMGVQTVYSVKQLVAAVKENADVDTRSMNIIGQVVGWTLISVGFLYVLMSLLCLRKITGVDKNDELEVSLLGGTASRSSNKTQITVVSGGGGGGGAAAVPVANAADVVLIANMALALGMTTDEAKRFLGGKDGHKAAEKLLKDRANAAKSQALAQAQPYAANAVVVGTAVATAAATAVPAPAFTTSTYSQPPTSGGGINGDDDEPRRKRVDDDDDLEAAYYGAK